jgi:nucleoside-diphosphate-sugar epimerase
VYGQNGPGFVSVLIKSAKEKGEANFIEGTTNQVSVVHVEDAARLYVNALEKGTAGAVYNASTQSVEFKKMVEAVGQLVGVPVKGISKEDAVKQWGFLGNLFAMDIRGTALRAEKELGWKPSSAVGIIDEIVSGSYKLGFQ